ncbi:ribonuclease H-like domain-containing protein [Mycena filopes]|nr:ribonuclease H-like domain-containing protein [Mycena filopes]
MSVLSTPMNPYTRHSTFVHIKTQSDANDALRPIRGGVIGFDTEFKTRVVPGHEAQAMLATAGTKADRRAYQIARVNHFGAQGIPVDWSGAGLCIVQIARHEDVYIIDLKRIRAFPSELRRILEDEAIAKVGTGFGNDGKAIWEDLGCNVRTFVDVGFMIRLWNPEGYATRNNNISLEDCVADLLGLALNKAPGTEIKWDEPIEEQEGAIEYAGLDAQASLEIYNEVSKRLRSKELTLGRLIPNDWYTYHFVQGAATRTVKNYLGMPHPWSYTVCPWYVGGVFSNYHL